MPITKLFLPAFLKVFVLSIIFFAGSCSPTKKLATSINKKILKSATFNRSHTGFMLYNLENKQVIFQDNADKYFTPASNTKVFTFYTALNILEDAVPAMNYEYRNDTLYFWGTGDPTFLNQYLIDVDTAFHFLEQSDHILIFSSHNFDNSNYGEGWMWDDYPYSFQPEISSFPIYSNLVTFKSHPDTLDITAEPSYFQKLLSLDSSMDERYVRIRRDQFTNHFRHNAKALSEKSFIRERPFKTSPQLLTQLLVDTLKKPVFLADHHFQPSSNRKKLVGHSPLPLYQALMQNSDNHIAEQLLLLCANEIFDTLQTKKIIQYSIDSLLLGIPDQPLWVDGSGISRYNLFTPRSLVWLWEKIYEMMPESTLFPLLATGGVNGTIKQWYAGEQNNPYIFGKTGTVRNCHTLSGFLKTTSGKTLIFSFMHNNFKGGSKPFKQEMEYLLKYIRDNF